MKTEKMPILSVNEHHLWICLERLGINYKNYRHPPIQTVRESQKIRSLLPEMENGHCKNLFLRDKQRRFYLFVTLENKPINFKQLQDTIPAQRISLGKPSDMSDFLGVEPGSVTPFAAMNPSAKGLIIVLDREILNKKYLNFHPLHNRATTTISSSDLILFLKHFRYLPKIVTI